MANVKINRLPSGSYNAKVYSHLDANGKRHYKSLTGRTKSEVKLMIADFLSSRTIQTESKNDPTLSEAIDRYIDSKTNVLSPSTVREYRRIHRRRFQNIMQLPISQIDSIVLQQEINLDAAVHSPKTVRNTYGLISSAIRFISPDKHFNVLLPQKEKPDIIIPTEDEMRALLKYIKDSDLEIPVLLGSVCGMRRSEIAALKWTDVDLDRGLISIHSAVVLDENRNYVEKGTKTTSGTRIIKIFAPALNALSHAEHKTEYVCSLTPAQISDRFFFALKQANIRHFRFHDLRHYAVSVMLSLNMPKKYIADYVGHQSETMIDNVYGHIMINAKNQFMTAVDQYYSALFPN